MDSSFNKNGNNNNNNRDSVMSSLTSSKKNQLDRNDPNFINTDETEEFEEKSNRTPNSYQASLAAPNTENEFLTVPMQKIYDTITEPKYVKSNTERHKKMFKTFEKAFSLDKLGTGLTIGINFPKEFK